MCKFFNFLNSMQNICIFYHLKIIIYMENKSVAKLSIFSGLSIKSS